MANGNPYQDAYNALMQLGQGITRPVPGSAFQVPTQVGMDPAVTLDALEQQRFREARRNLELSRLPGTAPMTTGATPSTVEDLASDLGTGDIAQSRAVTEPTEQAIREATLAGFQSPQQMAAAQRQATALKTMAPVEAARLKAAGDLAVEEAKARSAGQLQSGEFSNILNLLHAQGQGGQPGDNSFGSFTLPSGSTFSFGHTRISTPSAVPAGGGAVFQKELQTAQDNLTQLQTAPNLYDLAEEKAAKMGIPGQQTIQQRISALTQRIGQLQAQARGTPYVTPDQTNPNAYPPEAMQLQPHQVYTDPTTGHEWLKTMSGQVKRIR